MRGGVARIALVAAAAVLAAAAGPAVADKTDKADVLFARGKAQLAKKQYAEACTTFERVDELDPGIGAKLNVARCYQEWGRLVRARKWYIDAQKMAASTGDKRASKIQDLIDQIEPDLPRLTLRVPEGADAGAAAVAIDGEPVAASELDHAMPVEPGPHVITYRAAGEQKTKTIAIERGGSRDVTLELPGKAGAKGPARSKQARRGKRGAPAAPVPGRSRRIAGFALMGAGAVGMGISGYLALGARSDYHSALDAHCMGAKDMCDVEGLRLTHDARSRANLATVFALAGAAILGGGVALYVTAPSSGKPERMSRNSEALYVAPAIGDRAGFLVIGGRY